MKKDTNWVTIPDDVLHTPASISKKVSKKKADENHTKSNIFFGAAFVVLVLVTFALLAPNQFSGLLKGSLFDTSDVTKKDMKINLLPKQTSTSSTSSSTSSSGSGSSTTPSTSTGSSSKPTATSTTTGTSTKSASSTTASSTTSSGSSTSTSSGGSSTAKSTNVVKPESKAVSISIAPTAKDCKTDMSCLLPYLKDCKLAKGTYSYKIDSKDFETSANVTGAEKDNCLVTVKVTKSPDTSLTSTEAKCKIKKGTYTKDALDKLFASTTDLNKQLSGTYCTGTAVTNMSKYLAGVEKAKAAAVKVKADAAKAVSEAKAVADLKAELEKLKKQQKADAAKLQNLKSAASKSTTTTTTQVPTSVTSTSTIGQPTGITPGFKANPYKVSSTPQQVLQQNLASGYTTSQSTATPAVSTSSTATSGNTVTYHQPYSVSVTKANNTNKSLSNIKKTPSSGPTEMLLITFVITFLGLVGWKFRKVFG